MRLSLCSMLGAAALLLGLAAAPSKAQEVTVDEGSGSILIPEARGATPDPLRVWYHRPKTWTPEGRILFVMHGVQRNGEDYRNQWRPHADAYGFLLIVPEFSSAKFPRSAYYNFGNVFAQDGAINPRDTWTYGIIESVFDRVKAATGARRDRYSLFGHSAGAQYVHRLLTFMPSERIDLAVPANAGWYTLPVRDQKFPYGLGDTGVTDDDLRRLFSRPVTVLLGEADTETSDPNLRSAAEANAQGPHRFLRGQNYLEVARREALRLGVPLAWRIETVPGVGHSNELMSEHAARILFR